MLRFELVAAALRREARRGPLRVLDAGCGEGYFACYVARRHRDWTIVGVDRAEELLGAARASASRQRLANVEFVRADLTDELGERAYDAVVSIESLEEIPDDTAALTRMIAALRAGGLFVAHVPEQGWKPVFRGSETTWRNEVRHGYAAGELRTRLASLGLEQVVVTGTSHATVRFGQELRDRARTQHLAARAALIPVSLACVALERRGLKLGQARALLVTARRIDDSGH